MSVEIAVHGLGYVGLTAAIHYAKAGKVVMGYDPDQAVVDGINSGKPKAGEFLGYLGGEYDREHLRATTNFELVAHAPVHVVCVPSEKDGKPWMDLVEKVLTKIVVCGRPETTVIVESTLTPGTLSEWVKAMPFNGFHLAHAPRRDWFADPAKNLATLQRVVGGMTPGCTEAAVNIISAVTPRELILETDMETAELVKPLENAFLHAPVMLACEIARVYPHLDTAKAVELACTHWRLMKVYLNAGTGGRCVPLGTQYLHEGRNQSALGAVLRGALDGEGATRGAAASAISCRLKPNSTVLTLGVAYRPNFKDAGNSPGLSVAQELWKLGHRPYVADPMWTGLDLEAMCRLPVSSPNVTGYDAVFLATPHEQYLDPKSLGVWSKGTFVLDAQGAWASYRKFFEEQGVEYKRIGDPDWL